MRGLLCWLGWHRWFPLYHWDDPLGGYLRSEECPFCRAVRVRRGR